MAIVSDRLDQIAAVLTELGAGDPADLRRALREYDVRDIIAVLANNLASPGNGDTQPGMSTLLGPYPIEYTDVPYYEPFDVVTLPVGTIILDWYGDPDTAELWENDATLALGQGVDFVSDSFLITAIDQGTKTFTVAGDRTATFTNGTTVYVSNSTGNDGTYTVVSSTFAAGSTEVVVAEAIADPTPDGIIGLAVSAFASDLLGYLDATSDVAASATSELIAGERIIAGGTTSDSPIKVITDALPVQAVNTSIPAGYSTGRVELYFLVATPTLTVPS